MNPDPLGRGLLSGRISYPGQRYLDRLLGRLDLDLDLDLDRAPDPGRARGPRAGDRAARTRPSALDAGCGDGLVGAWLAAHGWKVRSEDREAHAAWAGLARKAGGRLRFFRRDASLAGGSGGFDLVLAKDMLHHVDDPVAVLGALKARVQPGGRLLVLECNRLNPVFYLHLTLMKGHQHFTRRRLLSLLDRAGLGAARLDLIEARVWPWGGPAWQDAFERLQDLAEALPFWRPFVCYHAVTWVRPARGARPGPGSGAEAGGGGSGARRRGRGVAAVVHRGEA